MHALDPCSRAAMMWRELARARKSLLPLLITAGLLNSASAQPLVDPVNQVGNFYSFSTALQGGAFQVVWGKCAGASYYLVQYAASSSMLSPTTVNISSGSLTPFCTGCTGIYKYTYPAPPGRRSLLQSASSYYQVQACLYDTLLDTTQATQPQPTSAGTSLSDPGNLFVFLPPLGTNNSACTWAMPCDTIQQAILEAPYDGATIWMGPGTYMGDGNVNISFNGRALHLASLAGAANTVIDMDYTARAFTFTTEGAATTLTGLTMQNGVTGDVGGAAIYMTGATSVYISYCTFMNNLATGAAEGGGAVACYSNEGVFTIVGCTFIGNTAPNGGGIMVDNTAIDAQNSFWGGIMLGCRFLNNWANATGAGRGGAIFLLQTQWAMNDTWVQNNTATLDGGGMHIEGVINYVLQYFNITLYNNTAQNGAALNEAASFLGFTDCLVLNNTGTLYGGGLFAFYSGLTVENATIIGNIGEFGGGGIKTYQAYVAIDSSLVANNTSAAGGGLQQDYVNPYIFPPGEVLIYDTLFEGNVASQIGGGISAATCNSMGLQNVNFSGNLAPKGGAFRFGGDGTPGQNAVSMQSCYFTNSAADYGGAVYADVGALGSLDACVFTSNTAKAAGGALLADDESAVSLTSCLFQGNGDYSNLGAPESGGAISVGIDEFKVVTSSGALAQPAVSLAGCQLLGNIATDSGGAISIISGSLSAQGTTISGNIAGSPDGTTGLGGGIYMQDSCSGGTCTTVSATLLSSTLTANYAHLAGAGLFYDGANTGSSLQVNSSVITSNYLDSPYTGSPQVYSLGGGLILLQSTFALENNSFANNTAYLGGGVFINADLSAGAYLDSLSFSGDTAAEGSSVFWVHASSPGAALACSNCVSLPASNYSIATEPLTLAFVQPPPTTAVSAQVTAVFQVGLEDYYGHISTAFAAGTCQIMSPSAELLLPEGGRISAVQSGVASFSQFQVSGGIGNSFVLSTTCDPSTAGQLSYFPGTLALPALPMPIVVAPCGQGTELQGESVCKQCALDTYDFDGLTCLPCPYGGFCPGGSNGEITPLQSESGFWRSSAVASELFRCPYQSCEGTPEYSGNAVGDAACTTGTKGPVCAVCDTGYYQFSGGCQSCGHVGITVLVIAAIAVVAGIIFIFSVDLPGGDNVSGGPMNKYKIITTHFQLLSLLRDYDLAWPTLTISLLSYSDSFNVGISIVAPACFISHYNFFVFYIATLFQPVLAVMLCGGMYLLASSMHRSVTRPPVQGAQPPRLCFAITLTEEERTGYEIFFRKMKGRCYKNIFYLVTLVYPRCAQTCLQLFSYMKLDIGTFLYSDFTILVRDTAGHWAHLYLRYFFPGIAVLLVFAIGLPIWYLVIMYLIRNHLQDEDIKQRFGFLYQGYSFQYWETIDMFRKLMLGAIPVFIAVQPEGSLQAVLGEIVLVGTLAAQLYIMPFLEFSENMISISSMSVLWLVLLTGEVAKWGHLSAFQTNVIAGLQMALTSGVAAVVALIVAIGLYTMMKKRGPALLSLAREKGPALLRKAQLMLRRFFPGCFNKVKDESTEMSDRKGSSRRQSSADGGEFIQAINRKHGHGGHLRDVDADQGSNGGLQRGSMTQHLPLLQHEDDIGGPGEDYEGDGEPYPEVDFQAF